MLAEEFSNQKFYGLEPFGNGFAKLKELTLLVQKLGVNIKFQAYEQHQEELKYDLIYCVNVFEHVDDWQHFLFWASKKLNK